MKYRSLRVITNLHCNQRCTFCYQRRKPVAVLPLQTLKCHVDMYRDFEYCTIMGGESTLLPDLPEYIKIGAQKSKQVRLTTNGSLITPEKLALWKDSGLTGINVSIPIICPALYRQLTGSSLSLSQLLTNLTRCIEAFGREQVRVNIPLCLENMQGEELTSMLFLFLIGMKIKVTICEDILRSHSVQDHPDKFMLTLKQKTGFGLTLYDFCGREVGCYGHEDNYKHTDLIVSPVGTFSGWDEYCYAVGLNQQV